MARKKLFKNFDAEAEARAREAAMSDPTPQFRSTLSEEFTNKYKKFYSNNGDNFIDFIPFVAEESFSNLIQGDPNWRILYKTHSKVGPKSEIIVCPRTFGEPCPICDKYDEVKYDFPGEKGSTENKEYYKNVVGPLQPKNRAVYYVVDRSTKEKSDEGVKFLDMASFYIEENIGKYAKNRLGEPIFYYDEDDGKMIHYTWEVDEEARKKGQQSAPKFAIVGLEDREMPGEDGKLVPYVVSDEELDATTPLGKWIFNVLSYDEIVEIMEGSVPTNAVSNQDSSTDEQLDDAFGKTERTESRKDFAKQSSDEMDDMDDIPWETKEEEKEEENPPRSRRTRSDPPTNPDVEKVMKCEDMEALDNFCEEKEIDLYADDFNSLDDFKEAVLEFVKK